RCSSIAELFGIDASSAQYSSNETAISVTWQPSSTSGVSYQLTCKRVGSGEVSTASSATPSATCGSLQSGQAYELQVAVQKAGGFDDVITSLPGQLTKLSGIDASSAQYSSNETAISVTWQPPSTSGVSYQLTCKRVGSGEVSTASSSTPSATCGSLQSGQEYELRVAVQKAGGFDDVITRLSNQLTKLFPIDASLVSFTITETSISLTWVASITEGVLYRMTCSRVSTGNSSSLPPSKYLSATVSGLQSGEAYNLSVAVSKQGGFHEVVTWLPIQLTKLFGIDASSAQYSSNETAISVTWQPSSTSGVSYQLTCKRVGSGEVSTASSSTPSGTCGSLQSGQAYELRVAVQKSGGFDDVITPLSNQLTKLFGIDASSAQYSSNETAISVTWQPSSNFWRLVPAHLQASRLRRSLDCVFIYYPHAAPCSLDRNMSCRWLCRRRTALMTSSQALSNQLTKLFGIDASSAQYSSNETAISVTWQPSSTSGVSYQLTCRRVGSGEVSTASSTTPSATCGSLQSGQEYELRVAVWKAGGFADVITRLSNQLTKLFPIDASLVSFTITETSISLTWVASITEGVLYRMTCRRVSTGNSTSLPPSKYLSATFSNLQSGEAYNLS
uniref:Protein-tyrosine-phosphatase n=1 Tax=Macrostomum lignano TaxID=282301 RepID=A0A1I8HKT5_9PLAT